MCGICGEINIKGFVEPQIIKKMCWVLAHRGPDDEGMVFFKNGKPLEIKSNFDQTIGEKHFEVGLGHRRLSIIDLTEAAHQPMGNEDRSIWIVYNGEIYNFQELRKELEEKGHIFKSRSDTEVILHGYEQWDIDCLKYLRGMFAFAIWDNKKQRLFMARDRLGKKPLVYLIKNGGLIFASEIKALLQNPLIEKKINPSALHYYLTYQYVPSPDTIFEGIKKLPPAHYLIYEPEDKLKIERYWKIYFNSNPQKKIDINQLKEQIQMKLEESVKLRLISDVPLGAFLSGGIDSSLVVGLMARLSAQPIKTFSIGFEEKDFDELNYARLVSNHFSTEHHEFIVKPDAIEILPKLAWHYNEPFADSSAIPTYYVAKMTKDYVKVVLTGDAGDENFAGYPRYLRSLWVDYFCKIPERIRKGLFPPLLRAISTFGWREKTLNRLANFIESLSSEKVRNYGEQIKIFNTHEKEILYSPEFKESIREKDSLDYLINKAKESETEDLINQLMYLDIQTYLPEDLLVKMDIATMANSLEARVPFLDHLFMEFVATIPSELKLKKRVTKHILKQAFSDFLPPEILHRNKMGFGVPVTRWFREHLKDYIYEVLLDQRTLNRGYFQREGIERLLNEHLSMQYDHSAKIWALLFLETWFRVYMDEEGWVA